MVSALRSMRPTTRTCDFALVEWLAAWATWPTATPPAATEPTPVAAAAAFSLSPLALEIRLSSTPNAEIPIAVTLLSTRRNGRTPCGPIGGCHRQQRPARRRPGPHPWLH